MIWTVLYIVGQAMFVIPDDQIITYKTYDASTQNKKSWEQAKSACSQSKSLLALLDTKEKISAVKDSLSNGPYWIGLKYKSDEQEFIWSSGEVANRSFLNGLYNGNEKSLVNSGKTCFLLTKESHPFKKEKCNKKYGFICQTTGQGKDQTTVIRKPLYIAVEHSATNSTATLPNQSTVVSADKVSVSQTALEKNSAGAKSKAAPYNSNSQSSASVAQTLGFVGASYPTIQRLTPTRSTLSVAAMQFQATSTTKTPLLKESVVRPSLSESYSISKAGGSTITASTQEKSVEHLVGSTTLVSEITIAENASAMKKIGQTMSISDGAAMLSEMPTVPVNAGLGKTGSKDVRQTLLAQNTRSATMRVSKVDTRSKMKSTQKPVPPVGRDPEKVEPTQQKEQTTIKKILQRMESLNVEDPVSINGATNIWGDCVEFVEAITRQENDFVNAFLCGRSLEDFAIAYAHHHLNTTNRNMWITNTKMTLSLTLVTKEDEDGFTFEQSGVFVHLPANIFRNQDTIVYTVICHALHEYLSKQGATERSLIPNTHIADIAISPTEGRYLLENITLAFQHVTDVNKNERGKCAFWNFSTSQWSTLGCSVVESNASSTVCTCNHLTNFAVLIQTRTINVSKVHSRVLELMTYIGLGLSLIGEAITLASYFIAYSVAVSLRDQQEQQLKIRRNLVASLALAQIAFLSGIGAMEVEVVCILMAALVHYFYLVAFCWMLVEGIYLYMMVVKVYHAEIKMSYCNCFAFGAPAVFVASTLCLTKLLFGEMKSYVSSYVCWLSFDNYLIWSFIGPVILIELTNAVILFRVLKEMATMQRVQTAEMDTFRQSVKACMVLFPLLGITWLFGLLSLLDSGVTVQYIFTLLNSTQGFLIFIFHCLRNSQIRAACGRRLEKWLESKSYSAGGGGKTSGHQVSVARAREQEHSSGIGMIELIKRTSKITPVDVPSAHRGELK